MVQMYINDCSTCQKHNPIPKVLTIEPIIPDGRLQHWQMDLVDMQALTDHNYGKGWILCIIDLFTKFAHCCALKNKEAATIVKKLRKWIQIIGEPKKLQSDNGGEFKNHLMSELCKYYNIEQVFIMLR